MLYQLIYSSQAVKPMSADLLEKILTDAREGNARHNITGALIYVDGVFMQIVEGEKQDVDTLMAGISNDSRHQDLTIFYQAEVAERAFPSWKMAYLSATPKALSIWAGLPGTDTIENILALIHDETDRVPGILVNIVETLANTSST